MTKPAPIAIVGLCILAISVLAFTINEEYNNKKKPVGAALASKNANIISPLVAYNPPHGQPGHRHDLPDGAPLPNNAPMPGASLTSNNSAANGLNNISSQPASEVNAGAQVNPPHGQPGHKCGIAEGAPLNSVPAKTTIESAANATNNAGKNPAHGQPGHRCDIAVGAPLNSTPAKTTAPVTTTTTTSANANTTTVATGLNPAHGQPGHRCDIAVGAPLNSSAKTPAANTAENTTTNSSTLNPSVFPNYNFPTSAPQFQSDTTRKP